MTNRYYFWRGFRKGYKRGFILGAIILLAWLIDANAQDTGGIGGDFTVAEMPPAYDPPKIKSLSLPQKYACSVMAGATIVVQVKTERIEFQDIETAAVVYRALRKAGFEASWRIEVPLCLEEERSD